VPDDDDITARLRVLAEQMGWQDDSDVLLVREAADRIEQLAARYEECVTDARRMSWRLDAMDDAAEERDRLRADIARLTRQVAFDPVYARLSAAGVAIEDSGKLPEGWRRTIRDGMLRYAWADGSALAVSYYVKPAFQACFSSGAQFGVVEADDPVEAAVAAIAAATEGA